MVTFSDVLHEENNKRMQTLESAQYGLEIILKSSEFTPSVHVITKFAPM